MFGKIRKVKLGEAGPLRSIRLALVKENPRTFGILYETERRKPQKYFEDDIRRFSGSDSAIFFLEIDGQVVGMAKVGRYDKKDPHTGYLSSMGILKKYQGQGWGEKLLAFRLEWIRENTKFKRVLMIIVDGNERMTKLAHKYGFSKISQGSFYRVPNTKFELKL